MFNHHLAVCSACSITHSHLHQLQLPVTKMLLHTSLPSIVSLTLLSSFILSSDNSEFLEESDKYIDEVETQWKQYRNLAKDGFIYNDSFIVFDDYEELVSEVNDYNNNLYDEMMAADDAPPATLGDIPQLGFESTLMGMVNALQEIQSKGDQMMDAISNQKKVLVKLRTEVSDVMQYMI